MKDKILKKIKSAKKFRIFLIVLSVLYFLSILTISVIGIEEGMIITFLLFFALIISGFVYLICFYPMMKSVKGFQASGFEKMVDDIPTNPTLPKSRIYCGSTAFLSKKPFVIVPYSEIAWVYMQVNKAYGITVEKQVHIYCKSGKHFILRADVEELKWLLETCISKFNQNIIVGYGAEQERQYKAVRNAYKNQF